MTMNLNLSSSYFNSTRRLHNQTGTDLGSERLDYQNDDQTNRELTITDRRHMLHSSKPTLTGILDADTTNNDGITPRDDHSDISGLGISTYSKPLLQSKSSLVIQDFKKAVPKNNIPAMKSDAFKREYGVSSSPKGFERFRFPITDPGAQTSRRNSGFRMDPASMLAQKQEDVEEEASGFNQDEDDEDEDNGSSFFSQEDYDFGDDLNTPAGNKKLLSASPLSGSIDYKDHHQDDGARRKHNDKFNLKLNLGGGAQFSKNKREQEKNPDEEYVPEPHLQVNLNTFGNEFLQAARVDLNSPTLRNAAGILENHLPLEPQDQHISMSASSQVHTQQSHELVLFSQLEAELFLKGRIMVFLSVGLVSALILLYTMGKITTLPIFAVLYCYFIYYTISSIKRAKIPERSPWREAEEWFNVLQGISVIFFLVYVHLDFLIHFRLSIIGPYALLIHLVLYCIRSPAPNSTKLARLVRASFYTLQAFLITCQLDGFVNWDWRLVFMFTWLYCGIIVLYFISFGLLIVMLTLFTIFKQNLEHNMSTLTEFLGLFWHLLYYGQSLVALLVVYGLGDAYSSKDPNLHYLQMGAICGIGVSLLLAIFTIFGFKKLTLFIQFFNSTTSAVSIDGTAAQQPKKEIKFDVQKKESLFVMLSPTYFLPFDSSVRAPNQENLQKVRNVLKRFKLLSPQQRGGDTRRESKNHAVVDINVLKQYKEDLDEKFSKTSPRKRIGSQDLPRQNTEAIPASRRGIHDSEVVPQQEQKSKDLPPMKLCLSEGDGDGISELQSEPRTNKNADENLCYLCYSDLPNAVFMKCGHGGICYECATTLIKKKNECMQCRSPVEMIIKIDPNSKSKNLIKGVEFSKVNEV